MDADHHIAADGVEYRHEDNGETYASVWHPPREVPEGKNHGSAAVCLTADGLAVIGSAYGDAWEMPGGRPDPGEDWRATLDREVWEEACAKIDEAHLLGFVRIECLTGRDTGKALVRALWAARVSLSPWQPEEEIKYREVVEPSTLLDRLHFQPGQHPLIRRWINESLEALGH